MSTDGEESGLGLRERKKLRRRATIANAALLLFDAQGFRATTIAQVAQAADVSPRTVFAYFPAKEDLVFPGAVSVLEGLAVRLNDRPARQLTSDALRAWAADVAGHIDVEQDIVRRRVIDADEALRAYERRMLDDVGDVLAIALARDLDTTPDDMAAQLAASATVGALMALGRRMGAGHGDADERRREALALIDQAMSFVAGGIRELRARAGQSA